MNDFSQNSSGQSGEFPGENAEKWKKQSALNGDRAVRACMECRNAASRGVDNLADQLAGKVRRRVVCAVVALPRIQTFPGLQRIQIPSGKGTLMEAWVDQFTQIFLVSPGELEALATSPQPEPVLRWTAEKLRQTATKCCETAVKRRLWQQKNKFRKTEVDYHRSRITARRTRTGTRPDKEQDG